MSDPKRSTAPVDLNKIMTVHLGFFFRNMTIGVAQTIITHNIAKGLSIEALEAAVYRLVDRNPILTGILMFGNKHTGPGVFVETDKHDTFVHRIKLQDDIPSPANYNMDNASELMEYIQKFIEPHIPPSSKGTEELSKKLPLFGIHVIEFPDGHVYYAPRMSHAIGDGRTYYMVLQELNAILTATRLPPEITWESKAGVFFDFTHQIKNPAFWLSMIMMIIVYAVRGFPPTQNIMLSKEKLELKKKQLAKQGSYLSTNDVISAAMCESAFDQYNYFNQSVCYRHGRWPGVGDRDGGNITRLVPFSTALGKDPNQVRKLVDSLEGNPCRNIPLWSTFIGSGYIQTNWASLKQVLDGTIFHAPSQSVVDEFDSPLVIIHQPNDKEVGIMHKLRKVDPAVGLLSELTE